MEWDGGSDGSSWIDAQNWSGDILPINGGTVVIGLPTEPTIIYNIPVVTTRISILNSCESITVGGGHRALEGTARIRADLVLSGSATLKALGSLGANLLSHPACPELAVWIAEFSGVFHVYTSHPGQ